MGGLKRISHNHGQEERDDAARGLNLDGGRGSEALDVHQRKQPVHDLNEGLAVGSVREE